MFNEPISQQTNIRSLRNSFLLYHGDLRDYTGISATLLLTSTPHPNATSNDEVEKQINIFLAQNYVTFGIVDCETTIKVMPPAVVSPRGYYSENCRTVIEALTRPGDVVVDPYCGISFTGEVALKLGRKYIGIDINEDCCKKSYERLIRILEGKPALDERYIPR